MENGRNEIGGRQLVAGYLGVVLMDYPSAAGSPACFLG